MTNDRKIEILDKIIAGLEVQGRRSLLIKGDGESQLRVCRYRAPDGAKCAIGLLIPDEAYDPVFEGGSLLSPQDCGVRLRAKLLELGVYQDDNDLGFLRGLQRMHDSGVCDSGNEEDRFAALMKSYKDLRVKLEGGQPQAE